MPGSWLDSPDILEVTFHPRLENAAGPMDSEALSFPVSGGATISGRFYAADYDAPTILFFHGNGEIVADYDDIAPCFVKLGAGFLPVDYRGYGRSSGIPTVTAMLADARSIFGQARTWLADNGHSEKIVAMGRSLGSASALEIVQGCPSEVAGLIIDSGFADIVGLISRLGGNVPTGANTDVMPQTTKISGFTGPTLIIHGTADWIIPIADAQALFDASPSRSKKMLRINGAGHNDVMSLGFKEYMKAVGALIKQAGG